MISCDLDLQLRLGGGASNRRSSESSTTTISDRMLELLGNAKESQKQITIFYNGRVCVGDATEMKARAIISMAKRETEEQLMKKRKLQEEEEEEVMEEKTSISLSSSVHTDQGHVVIKQQLPMKRSLRQFLEQRKSRLNAASPYTTRRNSHLSLHQPKQQYLALL